MVGQQTGTMYCTAQSYAQAVCNHTDQELLTEQAMLILRTLNIMFGNSTLRSGTGHSGLNSCKIDCKCQNELHRSGAHRLSYFLFVVLSIRIVSCKCKLPLSFSQGNEGNNLDLISSFIAGLIRRCNITIISSFNLQCLLKT